MTRLLPAAGGQEIMRASIGEIFYFRDRRVTLCEEFTPTQEKGCIFYERSIMDRNSDIFAQAEFHINPTWSANAFTQWNYSHQKMEQASFNLQHKLGGNKIINMDYYWLRHDLEYVNPVTGETGKLHQADISFLFPLNLHWQLLSLWRYDLQKRHIVELLAGVEYNGCCIALQLVGSRYRQANNFFYSEIDNTYANGIFAQVVFKGLSSIPLGNPDSRLKEKIPGYIPLERRQQFQHSPDKTAFPPKEIPLY